jgi:hypothetical protein
MAIPSIPLRSLLLSAALGAATVTAGASPAAAFSYGESGYCSQVAADGTWGFVFGVGSTYEKCRTVRRALSRIALGPIEHVSSGRYRYNDQNLVSVVCAEARDAAIGWGHWNLQRAYRWAEFNGFTFCEFYVDAI